jgi:endonuclease/exonuclease/phosphatase family metal-dependent hydrolase
MNMSNMKSLAIALLAITAALSLSACSDNNNNNNNNKDTESLTVTSYNMGFALNFVPYAQERLPANEELMADYEGDVICLQEVWLEEYVEGIEQALSADFPYIYTVPPEQVFTETAACSDEEIADFAACGYDQCDGLSGNDAVACASTQCSEPLSALPPACFDGVIGAVGIPGITVDILIDTVTQPTGLFSYNGSLGLMLASKYELRAREFQDFIEDSSSNHRGALYAEIEVNQTTHVVGCTHPTANLSATIPYPGSGKHGSWEGENRFMQEQMIAFANNKAGDNPIFFAGDFNCSIANASNNVEADFADNCQLWLADGFADPAGDQLPCTFCEEENLLLIPAEGTESLLLDHVFVKNLANTDAIVADRVFDEPVSIEALVPPAELQPEDSPLLTDPSDHYGVELDIDLR